jgi:hypothetical protein
MPTKAVATVVAASITPVPALATCPAPDVFAPAAWYPIAPGANDIAIADFNTDGAPDIAVSLSPDRAFVLMLNNGDGTFAAPARVDTLGTVFGIAAADLNNDTHADVIVGGAQAGYVTVLLGDGSGGFGPPTEFGAGVFGSPTNLVADDFDADGNADIAVVTNFSNIRVFRGLGDGTLGAPDFLFVPGTTSSIELRPARMNADADTDLVLFDTAGVAVLAGAGGVTFTPGPVNTISSFIQGGDVADFNNDGNADAVYSAVLPDEVGVLLGNGAGGLAPTTAITVSSVPDGVRAADFDRDGNADAVVAIENSDAIALLLGDGAGNLALGATFPARNQPRRIAVADLDGNGTPDVAAVNEASNELSVYLNACPAACNAADLGEPFGQLTFADISAFLAAFSAMDPDADLATPLGQFTFADISAFLAAFSAGCP